MTLISEARVATESAHKYARQVGKHWAHSLEVEEDGENVRITFRHDSRGADWPANALVTLMPKEDALICRISASAHGQLEGLKSAVARHVDRFAFREAPLNFVWKDQ